MMSPEAATSTPSAFKLSMRPRVRNTLDKELVGFPDSYILVSTAIYALMGDPFPPGYVTDDMGAGDKEYGILVGKTRPKYYVWYRVNDANQTITVTSIEVRQFPNREPGDHETLKIIDLFLASSSELKNDREQVEIWINRENKKLVKKGVFLQLNLWEDFLDAMSKTRLQDEYNKVVAESDIVICLFATKVGKYTEEEFEVAYANFKQTGKPRYIYTYFKDVQVSSSDMSAADDLASLNKFKSKLNDLGHFYTSYKTIEDLNSQLKNQLDKIIADLL